MVGQGMGLEVTEAAKLLLADRGYDPTLGARPLRRAIQRLVEDPLSERLLWKEFHAGQIVVVDAAEDPEHPGQQVIAFSARDGFVPPPLSDQDEGELGVASETHLGGPQLAGTGAGEPIVGD
jgi:ATP-dependent Clp protease ATP-binding subunit ClpC